MISAALMGARCVAREVQVSKLENTIRASSFLMSLCLSEEFLNHMSRL